MIDWDRIQDLRMEIGPADFAEIVALFLEEADELVDRLSGPLDAKAVEHSLHFLKGSALNLGFTDLAMICQSGERRAAAGDCKVDLDQVVTIYKASRQAFLGALKTIAAA